MKKIKYNKVFDTQHPCKRCGAYIALTLEYCMRCKEITERMEEKK